MKLIFLYTMAGAGSLLILSLCFYMFNRPKFDADKLAHAETKMWQAYYTNNRIQLAFQLIRGLRIQYGLSLIEAQSIARQLTHAALEFSTAHDDYESVVLDDLTMAYRNIKTITGLSFDPREVARAELAWWVARRTPRRNSVENVGMLIGRLYKTIYNTMNKSLETASMLRANAAKVRDTGGTNADWKQVEQLLKQSYRALDPSIAATSRLKMNLRLK